MKVGIFKLSDLMSKSSELSINDAPPDCIIESKNLENVIRIIIDNLHVNPLSNKKEILLKHLDILVITDIQLDDTFPTSQFVVNGFSVSFRLD